MSVGEDSLQLDGEEEIFRTRRQQVPVRYWGLKFSEDDQGLSVDIFLEKVSIHKEARNVSEDYAFLSAMDLSFGNGRSIQKFRHGKSLLCA